MVLNKIICMPLIFLRSSIGPANDMQSSLIRGKIKSSANPRERYRACQSSWEGSHVRCLGFCLAAPSQNLGKTLKFAIIVCRLKTRPKNFRGLFPVVSDQEDYSFLRLEGTPSIPFLLSIYVLIFPGLTTQWVQKRLHWDAHLLTGSSYPRVPLLIPETLQRVFQKH